MKKLKLFFALFAMLALGIGNAWAEDVTFSFADATQRVSQDGNSQVWKSGEVVFTNARGTGNAVVSNTNPIRCYQGSSITIEAPGNISKLVFVCNTNAYATALGNSISSGDEVSSKNVTVTTSGSATYTISSLSAQVRINSLTVTYEAGSTTPKQKYTLTYQAGSVTGSLEVEEGANLLDALEDITPVACDPTSTEPIGWNESEITTKQTNAPTLLTDADVMPSEEHSVYYVFANKETTGGGTPTETTKEYTFSNYSAGAQYADNEEHKLDDDVTIYTTDCHFTTQLRIYSSSPYNGYVVSNQLPGAIKSMKFNAGNKVDVLVVYGSIDGNVWSEVGKVSVTSTSYNDYTLDFGSTNYTYFKLDVEGTQQVRIAKMSITYMSGGGTTTISDYTTSCSNAPAATLVSIAHTGNKTIFTEGDAFVKSTITATYDDETTKDVTEYATFTGYDMSTPCEQTVTVTYEGKTTSYTITVNPKPTYTITWNNAGTTNETKVVQGAELGELPPVVDCSNGKKFMGWTAATSVNNDGSGVTYIKSTDKPTENTTYYAVFAVVTSTGEPVTSYKKVTTISDGTYLIAATNGSSSYAYTGQVEGKKFGGYIGVTIENDEITEKPVEATEITVKVTDGKFSMHDGSKYLYLSSSANELHYNDVEQIVWALDADGKINITTYATRYLRFNAQSGNERFACYSSAQKDAFLYKKVTTTPETVSDYSLDCTIHTEPTWTISKDAIDFADKYVGVSYTETFTISASNLTDDIALAIDGSNFTVSPTSIDADATFPQTVTVTYAPTAADSHSATLNITSGSTLLKAIALTGSATEATIYTLTALADIKPTDKVIIVGTTTNGTYAMSNDKGTGDAPDAVAVEVADNKIATNETNILWNIAKNGDNLTIYPADQTAKWLYCLADENDGVRVGTGDAKLFTIDKGYLYTTQTTSARHIGIYNNSDWRCYKPSADAIHNNIKDQSFAFYVLPDTKPSISVSPESKDFGVLTVGETATQEFEITALNITQALTAEITGDGFTKSEIEDNKITITFAPTAEQEYLATLTISAGTEASASVTLAGEGVAAAYSVTYDKNGAEGDAPTDETKYVAGSKVTVAGQGDMTKAGYRFAGWKYGENIYKAGAKFTMPAENVTFVAQWEEKANFSEGFWVLVTDESELATDDYVVIAAADYNVAMKSYESGNNCKQVNITKVNDFLIWNENVGVFQLAKEGENYTFQDVNTEQYLYAAGTGTNNYLKAANEVPSDADAAKPYIWTISYTDGVATVKATSENRNTLMYNATEGTNGQLFSCYASNQKAIALYKYVTDYTYTHTPTNKYGTICLPYASASTSGAYFYEVVGKGTENGKPAVYLASVNSLKAGVPYIFEATASTIKVTYQGEAVDAPRNDDANGLVGTFEEIEVPDGMYILYINTFCTNEPAGTLNKIRANRAYLNLAAIEGGAPQQMPGRRYIGMSVQGENEATGFENITAPEGQTIKAIVNGQLVIIRGGEMYNVQGQKL